MLLDGRDMTRDGDSLICSWKLHLSYIHETQYVYNVITCMYIAATNMYCACIHTHTHTNIYTHINYINAYIHTYIQAWMHAHMQTHTHKCTIQYILIHPPVTCVTWSGCPTGMVRWSWGSEWNTASWIHRQLLVETRRRRKWTSPQEELNKNKSTAST